MVEREQAVAAYRKEKKKKRNSAGLQIETTLLIMIMRNLIISFNIRDFAITQDLSVGVHPCRPVLFSSELLDASSFLPRTNDHLVC